MNADTLQCFQKSTDCAIGEYSQHLRYCEACNLGCSCYEGRDLIRRVTMLRRVLDGSGNKSCLA